MNIQLQGLGMSNIQLRSDIIQKISAQLLRLDIDMYATARIASCFFVGLLLMPCFMSVSCANGDAVSSPEPLDVNSLSGDSALQEVSAFNDLGPRVSGTDGARDAAVYLSDRMTELGLAVEVDEFTNSVGNEQVTFRNVTAVHKGSGEKTVVLASHYDTKSGISDVFTGANDSASSTGLLIALAAMLKQSEELPYNVMFAFFDGEECRFDYNEQDGLHGSRRLAAKLKKAGDASDVIAVIVLDMIGDKDLTVTLPRNCSPDLLGMVFDVSKAQNVRGNFALSRGGITDDHVPFIQAGMPAVDLIDFEYGSNKGLNDYWHTDADTMDKLSAESLQIVGRVVVGMLNRLMER